MNAAVERFHSLDQTLADIKAAHNDEMTELRATLMEAQTRAALAENLLHKAREECLSAQRVTVKLLTQFSIVSKVFEEARELAMQVEEAGIPEAVEYSAGHLAKPTRPSQEMEAMMGEPHGKV